MADNDETPGGSSNAPQQGLSAYETLRAQNIERNNAKLRVLGLITSAEEKRSNDEAWRRNSKSAHEDGKSIRGEDFEPSSGDEGSDEEYCDGDKPKLRNRKRRKSMPHREGERKSRRLRNIPAQSGDLDEEKDPSMPDFPLTTDEERSKMVEENRQARQRAALEVAKAGGKACKNNPTATYDHCLMRVRTMTDKALANRVRAIERACGKHCVVKMAIFKSCLQDEGYWDLAGLASDALERLKGLQPPPSD
mmetsp:Transcript_22177/g.52394  ORF Transcript_22177/g.52394 Transcript_22177/m.52394 type:complete len:250 (-) Transcript_22177:920-1669(-)